MSERVCLIYVRVAYIGMYVWTDGCGCADVVFMFVCLYNCRCMPACIDVCMYVCMYVRMYVNVCVYVCVHVVCMSCLCCACFLCDALLFLLKQWTWFMPAQRTIASV